VKIQQKISVGHAELLFLEISMKEDNTQLLGHILSGELNVYTMSQKIAPFCSYNNFVKPSSFTIIFGMHILQ